MLLSARISLKKSQLVRRFAASYHATTGTALAASTNETTFPSPRLFSYEQIKSNLTVNDGKLRQNEQKYYK
ncbi:MAG: hypothetical protein ACI8RD_008722 [Bacillariaceae sp.]|jgi:hypothetical protein